MIAMTQPGIAARVDRLTPPIVAEMNRRARVLEATGVSLIRLVRGEPDFDTPQRIRQAATEALARGETHYPPIPGIPELRAAVAEKLARDNDLQVDAGTEVLITTGATMGLYLALLATVNPGDEVLLPDPVYDAYRGIIGLANGSPVAVPAERDGDHFALPVAALAVRITSRSKVVLLNTPSNPTGSVMRREELEAIADQALRHNLTLIVDEVYEKIIFDERPHVSLASLDDEVRARTITVNSFSKPYAMTGWRLGYNVAPQDLVGSMLRICQQSSRGPATFVQWAGVEALRGPQDEVRAMAQEYTRRRTLMAEGLAKIAGARACVPEGTFFVFVDMRAFGLDSMELATYLLNEAHVVTTPGHAYGTRGEGYIRLSFAASAEAIEEGLERVKEALERLPSRPGE